MAESRGLVKLFGKTIAVPTERDVAAAPVEEAGGGGGGGGAGGGGEEGSKNLSGRSTAAEAQQKDQESASSLEQSEQQTSSSTGSENHKGNPTTDQETPPEKKPKPKPAEEQNSASNGGQEKTIKKPDKILPCPRCNSMDTKFCYYNNYNVNQPRHFCKNCQRYWTAGGTMRNVPVGAGRRKNKHSASHYRHIAVAKAPLHPIRPDITEIVHHTELKPNRTVLSFAPDMPLCESMASVLNIAEKTGYIRNGFHHAEEHVAPFSCASAGAENAEEQNSSGSSVTASNSPGDVGGANIKDPAVQSCQGYPSQLPCFSGTPWPYPWAAAPAMCASSFPISFYPMTPYWGCTVPGAWSVPWMAPLSSSSSPPSSGSAGSGPISPTLGKHSRDGDALAQGSSEDVARQTNGERCLWIPKTLRIDDPEEAAKSSIWATMGFKNDKANGISRGGLFRDFNHPKADISNRAAETSAQVLHANPAALSRSLNFHESS